jgi:hypothetical protein
MSKPKRFGEKRGKFGDFGKGNFIRDVPEEAPLNFADFTGGYNSAAGREGAPNASPNTTDFEISRRGRLIRSAGTQAPAIVTALHDPMQVVAHVDLDNIVELIYFDTPSIGTRNAVTGAVVWTDLGLAAGRPFASTLFGETLLFSNGAGPVYFREPGQLPIAVPSFFQANSYAAFANRVYGLGTIIDGNFEPMGVRWTAANSDPRDATGDGSGAELLISAASEGDEGIAVRSMGLDFLALICRRSVWVGRRTNDPFRPADLQPRVIGNGGLTDRTVVSYPGGAAYLSDAGLRSFDGNESQVISNQINGELLPLDKAKINEYKLTYDPLKNRLLLNTPVCMWVYDLEFRRWARSSIVASDVAYLTAQVGGTTWAQLQAAGTLWSQLNTTTWRDLGPRAAGTSDLVFLKYRGAGVDSQTAIEDLTSQTQFGVPMLPQWETMRRDGERFNSLITVNGVFIEYAGVGSFRIYLPDNEGDLQPVVVQQVADTLGKLREVAIPLINTGRGAQMMLEIAAGALEISKLQLILDPRSTKFEIEPFAPREYRTDFNV